MILLYIVGLPAGITVILWRRRNHLFDGPEAQRTLVVFGFLYKNYGPTAWLWEVEVRCYLFEVCHSSLVTLACPHSLSLSLVYRSRIVGVM